MKVNTKLLKKYDTIFISVEDINDKITLGLFYVCKDEYIHFSDSLKNTQSNKKPTYQYYYEPRKITTIKLASLINDNLSEIMNNDDKTKVDMINNILKNKSYAIKDNGELKEDDSLEHYKQIVNAYFEERITILIKNSDTFPFKDNNIAINDSNKVTLRMYNVGQANLSSLSIDGHVSFIFDLGRSRKCEEVKKMLNGLSSNNKVTTIVISHFDNDHINYAEELPQYGANLEFIMPEFLNTSDIYRPNIQLLLYKAIMNGSKVCFMLNKYIKPIKYGPLTLYKGPKYKIDPNQSTNENSHGIATVINSKTNTVLVPGDMLYEDLGYIVKEEDIICPTHVIIPHHACDYSKCSINDSIVDLSHLEESFVFAGPHSRFHHPNVTHLEHYHFGHTKITRLIRKNKKGNDIYFKNKKVPDTLCNQLDNSWYDWIL